MIMAIAGIAAWLPVVMMFGEHRHFPPGTGAYLAYQVFHCVCSMIVAWLLVVKQKNNGVGEAAGSVFCILLGPVALCAILSVRLGYRLKLY